MITYGTNPGMVMPITGSVPTRRNDPVFDKALAYMGFEAGEPIGTSRSTSYSSAAAPTGGSRTCAAPRSCCAAARSPSGVRMLVVPGSQQVKRAAEAEGLDRIFIEAGAEWRESGCSMCIGMNGDTRRARASIR